MRRVLFPLASLVLTPQLARASDPAPEQASRTLSLTWAAPPTCPRAEVVLARVASLIGQRVEPSPKPELSVRAEVSFVQGSGFALRLSWDSGGGTTTRSLSAKSCDEIVDGAALFIAFSLAPDRVAKERGPDSTAAEGGAPPANSASAAPDTSPEAAVKPPARPETPGAPSTLARDAPSLPRAELPPLRFALGAYSALWLARLPDPSPGLVAFGALSRGPWKLSAGLGVFLPSRATAASGSVGGDLWLGGFKLDLAYGLDLGSDLSLAPLIGTDLELMHGVGTGALQPQGGYTMLIGLEAGLRLTLLLSPRWALLAQGELSVLTNRPSFYVEGAGGEVFRPPFAGAQLGLGVQIQL